MLLCREEDCSSRDFSRDGRVACQAGGHEHGAAGAIPAPRVRGHLDATSGGERQASGEAREPTNDGT